MERYQDPQFWLEISVTIIAGAALLTVISLGMKVVARRTDVPQLAMKPLRTVLWWGGLLLMVAVLASKAFDMNLISVVAGGLALVAIGFVAVWSLLSHFMATILLIILRPFKIDDWVEFPGEDVQGRVIDLNLFFTLLDNKEGEHFVIPNNMFFQKVLRHVPSKGQGKELGEQLQESKPATETEDA